MSINANANDVFLKKMSKNELKLLKKAFHPVSEIMLPEVGK